MRPGAPEVAPGRQPAGVPPSGAAAGSILPPRDPTSLRTRRLGILAGGGRLPCTIAESVIARGGSVHIVAIKGEADAEIAAFPHTWVDWGQVGRMVATLRRHADAMVIVGAVRRPNLWKLRPDLGFLLSVPLILEVMTGGDDSVLSRVVRFFEAKGIEVRGAHEVAPELLASAGPAGAVPLGGQARTDAELGFAVRAALGPLDAGQAVVVADGQVLAIEGAEGTDAMLARVRSLNATRAGRPHSGVLAKGPKPGQELRVDMPAVGPRTVTLAAEAGLSGLAVEAGATLLLDRSEAVALADAYRLAIEGLPRAAAGSDRRSRGSHSLPERPALRLLGRQRPNNRAEADIEKGLAAIRCLAPYNTGQAVVVSRAYILALAAAESPMDMLERVGALRQWGVGTKRRIGVLAARVRDGEWDDAGVAALLGRAAAAGLAGIAVTGPATALAAFQRASHAADRHELFLAATEEQP